VASTCLLAHVHEFNALTIAGQALGRQLNPCWLSNSIWMPIAVCTSAALCSATR
jgi:hypothetical protein